MRLSLFDLHCDTAGELFEKGLRLSKNRLAVSLARAKSFEPYVQVAAVWTPPGISDTEGYERFFRVRNYFLNDPAVRGRKIVPYEPGAGQKRAFLFSLEDARITEGKPERVDELWESGVRILTPLWRGDSVLGGAHDTRHGLTNAGKNVLRRALELGMIPDLSHASEASADVILSLSAARGLPCIASHSNAYAVCPVSRNLRERQIREIVAAGGSIGLNLHAPFLRKDAPATIDDVFRQIDYFFTVGAEHALCLGCDFDGGTPPKGLSDISALPRLADEMLRRGYDEAAVNALFFENAYRFSARYFGRKP